MHIYLVSRQSIVLLQHFFLDRGTASNHPLMSLIDQQMVANLSPYDRLTAIRLMNFFSCSAVGPSPSAMDSIGSIDPCTSFTIFSMSVSSWRATRDERCQCSCQYKRSENSPSDHKAYHCGICARPPLFELINTHLIIMAVLAHNMIGITALEMRLVVLHHVF